jgi:FkbM family methyltransferase
MVTVEEIYNEARWKLQMYFLEAGRRIRKCFNIKYQTICIRKHRVYIRTCNQVDIGVIHYVFKDLYHRPYRELNNNKPIILDLGTNIGLTILDFKDRYPSSNIIGCEMDIDNYKLAVRNCSKCANVEILNKAIWYEDGIVKYYKGTQSDAYSNADAYSIIGNQNLIKASSLVVSVSSISINSLVKIYSLDHIDYIKMDIEGAELEVLMINNEWLQLVKQIKIEYHHDGNDAEKIGGILILKGFTLLQDTHHTSTLIAYKLFK